jgi:hypothetical protein
MNAVFRILLLGAAFAAHETMGFASYMRWMRYGLLLFGAAAAESPQVYYSLNSLYGMASDRRHIMDVGAAWEMPAGKGFTAVTRARYLRVKQEVYAEDERKDNIYANTFPSTYRVLGIQTALRLHPWEWMPGFFSEALLGYKNITGGDWEPAPGEYFDESFGDGIVSYENHALETAIGFGYLWEMKRMRFALGFAFGPEFLFRDSRLESGDRRTSVEVLDLLRFNQFEIGLAF